MKLLALLLMGQLADAGPASLNVLEVNTGTLSSIDGGVFHVTGGCYLDDHACLVTGQELASKRAHKQSLEDSAKPSWVSFGAGAAIGVAVGVVVTYVLMTFAPPTQ